jgi:hypothetical protein
VITTIRFRHGRCSLPQRQCLRPCASPPCSSGYAPRRPEQTVLHRVLREHWPAFLERAAEAGGCGAHGSQKRAASRSVAPANGLRLQRVSCGGQSDAVTHSITQWIFVKNFCVYAGSLS